MNLIRKTYDTTEVQITSFQSSKGITEYHIFFQQTNCLEDFHTQLQHIQDVYAHSVEELPGNPVAIFRRYFLSDVTNQTDGTGTAFPLLRTINRTAGSDERHEDCIVGLAADWRTDTGVAKWVV